MKFRRAAIAVATAASLIVIPTTAVAGGGSYNADRSHNYSCKDSKVWKDYKYAPQCECECKEKDCDRDHRDRDKPVVKEYKASKHKGRVLKTD